jgi:hypothetical protein
MSDNTVHMDFLSQFTNGLRLFASFNFEDFFSLELQRARYLIALLISKAGDVPKAHLLG